MRTFFKTKLTTWASNLLVLLGLPVLVPCEDPKTVALREELIGKSRHGLALAAPWNQPQGAPDLNVRFFDGSRPKMPIFCCKVPASIQIAAHHIVSVDLGSMWSRPNGAFTTGPVIEMDERGVIVRKSILRIRAGSAYLSPNGKRFAYFDTVSTEKSVPRYGVFDVFVAEMDSPVGRRLTDLEVPVSHDLNARGGPSLDWSPDSAHLLFTDGKEVFFIDSDTSVSEKIADGYDPRWSPDGQKFVYMTEEGKAVLLEFATRKTAAILNGREILQSPLWSPDGAYVMFAERHFSITPCIEYGRLVVYRLSDGASVPIDCFGVEGPQAQWIQFADPEKTTR